MRTPGPHTPGHCGPLIFGIFHLIWASGWYVGLDAEQARIAFAKTFTLVYDLVVAGICIVAVPVALGLTMPWGRRLPQRLLGVVAWIGSGLLVIRSVASIVQTVYLIVVERFGGMGVWEPWFYLGAFLFSASTSRYWRREARAQRRQQYKMN